jgi:hypothetical protein
MHELRTEALEVDLLLMEVETERFPSIAASLSIRIRQGSGLITCQADNIWFEIDAWRGFVSSLHTHDKRCSISDLSDDFSISMAPAGLAWKIGLKFRHRLGSRVVGIDFDDVSGFELHHAMLQFAGSVARDFGRGAQADGERRPP